MFSNLAFYRALTSWFADLVWWFVRGLHGTVKGHSRGGATPDERLQYVTEQRAWLMRALRRVPWWGRGHAHFARISLAIRDVKGAYASATAWRLLASRRGEKADAMHLVAKVYLAQGMFEAAKRELEQIEGLGRMTAAAKEDLAAALIGLGDKAAAAAILRGIPPDEISAEGAVALKYAERPTTSES